MIVIARAAMPTAGTNKLRLARRSGHLADLRDACELQISFFFGNTTYTSTVISQNWPHHATYETLWPTKFVNTLSLVIQTTPNIVSDVYGDCQLNSKVRTWNVVIQRP